MAYDEETLEVFHNLTEEGFEAYRQLLLEREKESISFPEKVVEMIVKIFKD